MRKCVVLILRPYHVRVCKHPVNVIQVSVLGCPRMSALLLVLELGGFLELQLIRLSVLYITWTLSDLRMALTTRQAS